MLDERSLTEFSDLWQKIMAEIEKNISIPESIDRTACEFEHKLNVTSDGASLTTIVRVRLKYSGNDSSAEIKSITYTATDVIELYRRIMEFYVIPESILIA